MADRKTPSLLTSATAAWGWLRQQPRHFATAIRYQLRQDHDVPAWLISLLVHAVLLLLLAMVTLGSSGGSSGGVTVIASISPEEAEILDLDAAFTAAPSAPTEDGSASEASLAAADRALSQAVVDTGSSASTAVAVSAVEMMDALPQRDSSGSEPSLAELMKEASRANKYRAPRSAADGVSAAADARAAASGILSELQNDLEEGPIYLAWLLDGSISLLEDRRQLASTLQPFYEQYKPRSKERPRLMSAVVAYGQRTVQIQDTTQFGPKNLKAIRDLPIDSSGIENVMTAVQLVVGRYAVRARGRLRIVIWTDESGDDTGLLENVVQLCRNTGTVVHVVGPSSVFGTDRGLQPYTDKATGYNFLLPVRRGPDTCFQERLLLPYWFDSSAVAGLHQGFYVADGMPWYGGALRERLMSGVGPYALTRLALQTGGSFTLLDRPGEASHFDLAAMKGLFPSYANAAEINESIQQSAFRSAICRAVQTTYKPVNLVPPKMQFFTEREVWYPFRDCLTPYVSPAEFRSILPADLAQQATLVRTAAQVIEQSLKSFDDKVDWEYEYASEPSARWQAWYDLTRGRLLLMSIRHEEYLATCMRLTRPGNLGPATNYMMFQPGPQSLTANPVIKARKEEGERLLRRCVARNAGTPWEMLAQWELDIDLGVMPVQESIPPPQPVVGVPVAPPAATPRIVLPNL